MRDQDQILLETLYESFFYVPEKLYKEIKYDLYKYLEKIRTERRKRFLVKKQYRIDFSGTQWDFLEDVGESFVNVEFSSDDAGWYRDSERLIHIGLNNVNRVVMDTLEHEFSHFIQYHISRYKKWVKKISPSKNLIGGLPPKKYSNLNNMTVHGYKKGSSRMRRITHAHRPIEIYPDILSSIRSLQYSFQRKHPDYNPKKDFSNNNLKIHETDKWEKLKKEFFLEFLKALDNEKPFGHLGLASHIFKSFKKISPEVYNFAKKKAYSGFMNYEDNFNKTEHEGMTDEISTRKDIFDRTIDLGNGNTILLSQKPKVETRELEGLVGELTYILNWEETQNKFKEEKFPEMYRIVRDILITIGMRSQYMTLRFPMNIKDIKTVFQRLKVLEDKKIPFVQYPFSPVLSFNIEDFDLKTFYKTIYNFLVDQYKTENSDDTNRLRSIILDIYESPKKSISIKRFEQMYEDSFNRYYKRRLENK
jgi:hypothetical protein